MFSRGENGEEIESKGEKWRQKEKLCENRMKKDEVGCTRIIPLQFGGKNGWKIIVP